MAPCSLCKFFGLVSLAAVVAPQAYPSPPLETISVASEQFIVDPANIVLDGTTVSANGPAVTVGGNVVFEDGNEDVFVNGVEVLTGPTAITQTTSGTSSEWSSQSKRCHADVVSDILLKWRMKALLH